MGSTKWKAGNNGFRKDWSVQVHPTGLWLPECGYLGASQDGLLESNGIVEVKCSFKYRNSLLSNVLQKSDIIHYESGSYKVNTTHNYFHQIQGQLYCTNRQYWKLVMYTTVDVAIVTIHKCPEWVQNIDILKQFYFEQYIRYITL